MLESLYKTTLDKKDTIDDDLDGFFDEDFSVDCWNDFKIEKRDLDFIISGSDGSYNNINYIGFILYAVGANCLVFQGNGLEQIECSEVSTILPYKYIRDRLRNYMSILEFKSILKAFNQYSIDLHLYDGSILGNIIRPISYAYDPNFNSKKEIEDIYIPIIQNEIKTGSKINLTSPQLYKSIEEDFTENKLESIIHLEWLENIISAYELLKNNRNIVAISKTSLSHEIFDLNVPDMAVFDKYCVNQGYSEPLHFKISKSKRSLPIYNKFFRNLDFTVFYVRLEDYKHVLKFEIPYKASKKDVNKLLEMIKSISTDGYPYLLKKAHHSVVIKDRDMDRISKMLGLHGKDPRGML
ncbi:DNA double-strand break repair nuclease NurA [Methanobacterium sp. MBAC-LM]|uniref:DNA double-strand break repair nuclease NurA n=1 Tax=Methanobacterium sp. MBAC-LM TaxID=3412034 RepID=UPI003C75C2F9